MIESKDQQPRRSFLPLGIIILLIALVFFVGSLWTRARLLENNLVKGYGNDRNLPEAGVAPLPPERRLPTLTAGEVEPVGEDDHVRGDRQARLALIEYSDLECPFCKRFHPTARQLIDEYPGQVMWVYRHFPLDQIHSQADKEAEAIECAGELGGNEGFWKLTDKLFEVTPSNNGLNLAILPELAVEIGLDRDQFWSCLESGRYADRVEADYQSGLKAGVTGTPGNILLDTTTGKTKLVPGAVPYPQLKEAVDEFLSES